MVYVKVSGLKVTVLLIGGFCTNPESTVKYFEDRGLDKVQVWVFIPSLQDLNQNYLGNKQKTWIIV